MNETPETHVKSETEKTCVCGTDPMHCLEKTVNENPMRAVWWALGIGLLAGWKMKSCLHSMMPHKS